MKYDWSEQRIQCPYYNREDAKRIMCEGIPDNTYMATTFHTAREKIDHKRAYCECRYNKCRIASALNRKYDEVGT